ncbi:cell wall hydrolase [Heyndrickxia shackletonii]|uniref:Cell wall hydrolase n=1 Tax=Heyndrickxia shackletonii TaxID=157838 RepID=A0A0Q3WW24_9BACI|nr:N-acetylmuramoyl-L-alanine amidase [Heyndrickxia shackletonii]KQL53079.1 cell wall hydrolase [Heyndrickxia shackletonii]NEZ02303.1 N-acetylmuramoyl-L-alanine amidase [Heyndrickxia shackletonii]
MKIMLDAGHGPNTPGKRSPDNFKEFEFNSKVADFAKELLNEYKDVTVYFDHSKKEDVPLKERTDKANKLRVDCYVSIHANAYGTTWNDAEGIETYVYVTKPKEAMELAKKVQKNLVIRTGLSDRGVKTADFHVLRETTMTAILCECGFYTNKKEVALLKSKIYQKTCAEAIVKGIADQYHLKKEDVKTTNPPVKKKQYRVQIGAFEKKENAQDLIKELKEKGYDPILVE